MSGDLAAPRHAALSRPNPMNYRHAYHAGNFADVVKHAILVRILLHLAKKDTPFRVLDTHAGVGVYDLSSERAERTGEWRAGIGRLLDAALPAAADRLVAPYRELVLGLREEQGSYLYPGSPEIARRMTRPNDRLILIEKHPDDAERLRDAMAHDRRIKVFVQDGWTALRAHLPPQERRGVVLVDPPFEEPDEFGRMADGLGQALKRFATGVYVLWYPIKDPDRVSRFVNDVAQLCPQEILRLEFMIRSAADIRSLNGCGLLVVNPPWTLAEEARIILEALVPVLGQGRGAGATCRLVHGEQASY